MAKAFVLLANFLVKLSDAVRKHMPETESLEDILRSMRVQTRGSAPLAVVATGANGANGARSNQVAPFSPRRDALGLHSGHLSPLGDLKGSPEPNIPAGDFAPMSPDANRPVPNHIVHLDQVAKLLAVGLCTSRAASSSCS